MLTFNGQRRRIASSATRIRGWVRGWASASSGSTRACLQHSVPSLSKRRGEVSMTTPGDYCVTGDSEQTVRQVLRMQYGQTLRFVDVRGDLGVPALER